MLTANKGEWSEVYALFKLLAEKNLFAGDENLEKVEDLFYPIIKILRNEQGVDMEFLVEGNNIKIKKEGLEEIISTDAFVDKAKELFDIINSSSGAAFPSPSTEAFMADIYCHKIKAGSNEKADIKVVVHDLRTGVTPTLGFSIKSQLGRPSTLLNASGHTNFLFKVGNISEQDLLSFNSEKKFGNKFQVLKDNNIPIKFESIESPSLKNNLILIDSSLPEILANCLLVYYKQDASKLKDVSEKVETANPIGFDLSQGHPFYSQKIKRFLSDVTVGMMPSRVWKGVYEATGGYIIVKEDGEVLSYHIYSKNLFEDYLFNNTKFDTPSTSRHNFGYIFKEQGQYYLRLNLQVRFI